MSINKNTNISIDIITIIINIKEEDGNGVEEEGGNGVGDEEGRRVDVEKRNGLVVADTIAGNKAVSGIM